MDPARRLWHRAAVASALACSGAARGAGQPGPLVIWFTVEGAKALRRIGERYTADTGVEVVVETPDPLEGPSRFQQLSAAGKGPDIYIYAHDRIGEWIGSGLLRAVTPSRRLFDDIDPLAWRGFTWRGRLWGYPYAIEAVTLVYNKALVARPPASFDELIALDDELARSARRAILWDYTNTYFSWPLLAAGGGYAFRQRSDGSYDAHDTGVADAGAVAGAEWIARLIREGRMPAGSGYPEMEAALAQGRVAMMINGPWSWLNLRRAGIDVGVAKVPAVDGHAARPFVGIKGVMINRASRQAELAVEFIENYLLAPAGLRELDRAEPIGAPASRAYFAERQADPGIATIMASARDGVPTPSNPEMGRFWSSMKTALLNLSEGRQTPRQALDAAARRIVAA
ncbi:MAG: maltose/maltodextrin ABC transporter substrate-binding protein MalE [Burkholderiales bacterium]|nr:maltose/maltodextrin ABC transporter substrate-binding protein MalE [Burkholderiales bacterium]